MSENGSTAVTYLEVCPCCRKAARVVTAAGKKTGGFRSKEGGNFLIGLLVNKGHISPEEAESLRTALTSSELSEEADVFPWYLNEGAEVEGDSGDPQKIQIH